MSEHIREVDENVMKSYDIKRRIGKGAYGIVWKAVDRKSREVVAVKKIFDAFRNQTDAQRTYREIVFLSELKAHPNVVRLHNILKAANNKDIYLVFEYMETDLHNVIKHGNILRDIHKRYISYQLLKAIKYIHSGNIIHRDLKPCNILLDSQCHCKVADFGLARSVSKLEDGNSPPTDPALTDYVATRWYRAPEILVASKKYTKGIDMWSIGCILAEMLLGKPLFPGSSTVNQVEKIMSSIPQPTPADVASVCAGYGSSLVQRMPPGPHVSLTTLLRNGPEDCVNLISHLLIFNPYKRLTAAQALRHQYVAKFHDSSKEVAMVSPVIPTLCDNVQLSVDDYRNKLYESITRTERKNAKHSRSAGEISQLYEWYRGLSQSKSMPKGLHKSHGVGAHPDGRRKSVTKEPATHPPRTKPSSQGSTGHPTRSILMRRESEGSTKSQPKSSQSSSTASSHNVSHAPGRSLHPQSRNGDQNHRMACANATVAERPPNKSAGSLAQTTSIGQHKPLQHHHHHYQQHNYEEPQNVCQNHGHQPTDQEVPLHLVTVSTCFKPVAKTVQHVNLLRRSVSTNEHQPSRQQHNNNKAANHNNNNNNSKKKMVAFNNSNNSKLSAAAATTTTGSPQKKKVVSRQSSLSTPAVYNAALAGYDQKYGYITAGHIQELRPGIRW